MPAAWLLGNLSPVVFAANIFIGGDIEEGNAFAPQHDCFLQAIRWYRANATAAQKPTTLKVWDTVSGATVYTTTTIPDSGSVGWQVHTLATPVALTRGRQYVVTFLWQTNRQPAEYTIGDVPPGDNPAVLWLPSFRFRGSPFTSPPNSRDGGKIAGIDAYLAYDTPLTSYTLTATTTYNDGIQWAQPADLFTLEVTTIIGWQQAHTVDGVDIRRVVGRWAPYANGFLGQMVPIDSPKSRLVAPGGVRMEGLVVDTLAGSAGTLRAYTVNVTG